MNESSQLTQYVPVLLLALVALAFAFGTLLVSVIVGWRGKRSKIKDTAYECGMLPIGEGSTRMSVRFYLVAMLFILFDIEVVFLYPWAVVYREMLQDPATRNLILGAMVSFLGILFVGYLYALKKRAFDWKS
jgi:NADH-quinone oxidoreductase subunit A